MEVVLHDRAQAGPEGTSKLHQEVALFPLPPVLSFLNIIRLTYVAASLSVFHIY